MLCQMLISPDQARAHLRIDGDADAADIVLKTDAAEILASEFLNRKIFNSQAELDAAVIAGVAGETPMVVNNLVRSAILLILGHLYKNCEDVTVGVTGVEIPRGSRSLLSPYRIGMGV